MQNNFEILEELLKINSKINTGIISEIRFFDKEVENLFLQDLEKNNYFQKVFSDAMVVAGYICSLLYIISAFFTRFFIISFSVFFLLCLLIIFFSYKYSKEKKNCIIIRSITDFFN